jgi:hypothetical protein
MALNQQRIESKHELFVFNKKELIIILSLLGLVALFSMIFML